MANTPPGACVQCKATGLPILPVRYTVVPKEITPALPAWASGDRVKAVDIGADFKYALRTMRTGFIYLFYEKHARGNRYWECYSVSQDGSLTLQTSTKAAQAYPGTRLLCANHSHVAAGVHYLVIEQPEKCGATWLAFSQDKWSDETVNAYTSNTQLRNARMQTIHPAQMIDGAKHTHGAIASKDALQGVLEYAATVNTHALPHTGNSCTVVGIGDISVSESGGFSVTQLTQMSTRYPWALREDMAEATATHMQSRAKAPGGQPGTPHVLALWDAIGIAHELNGFRNDAAGWIAKYGDERELQITALNAIEGAKKALVQKAAAFSDRQIRTIDGVPDPLAPRETRARTALHWNPNDRDAQSELDAVQAERQQRAAERTQNAQSFKRTNIAEAWPKYQANLGPSYERFKDHWYGFLDAAGEIIDGRTIALIHWLEASLLIDTLEDFHPTCIGDGLLFEDVIGDAIFGMGSCKAGQRKLDAWVDEAKASVKLNLLWRAIALNQNEGIDEVNAALTHAKTTTNVVLTAESWGAAAVAVKWSKLGGIYKNAQSFANTNIRAVASDGAMLEAKGLGFLKIFATAGDRIFPGAVAKKVDSVVSEKIFQSLFLVRAGAGVDDVLALAREQAWRETPDRFAMIRRMQAAKAFANVMEDSDGRLRPNAQVLQERWAKLAKGADMVGSDGRFNAAKDARLALVVAVLEVFNLSKVGYDASVKQDPKSAVVLGSAVASLAAAAVDVYANVVKGSIDEASMTFQRLKFTGGVLGGVASLGSVATAWIDAQKYADEDRKNLYRLAIANASASLLGGTLSALATLSYCGPWLLAVAERQAARRAGIAVATKLAAAAAMRLVFFRATLMGAGLAFNLVALGVQVAIWKLTDDELQAWCEKCPFGKKRDKSWSIKKMIEEFYKATYAVGVEL